MPIERKDAVKLASSWLSLKGVPEHKAVKDQAIEALAAHAKSPAHAKRVVDSIIETCIFWPTVHEVCQCCQYTPGDSVVSRTRQACEDCHGDGWISTDGPYGLSYAVQCNHDGQHARNDRGMCLSASQADRYREEMQAANARRMARIDATVR